VAGVPNPISKSLRFNSADSANLTRTPTSASNRKTWTWSAWVKRSALSTGQLFAAGVDNNDARLGFNGNKLYWVSTTGGSTYTQFQSLAEYRDPSAWYHIVFAFDTTQATAANRINLYVNGVAVASDTGQYIAPTLNSDNFINNNILHYIGRYWDGSYFNGYLTEINFIDGQALTPSSFGMTDPVTGVWEPLKYSGTYGTNGFYLNFKDATSTTTLGLDYSGNSNTWTTNNFSVTAGAGNDSLTDVPTPWIPYNTTGDVGGVVRGNYCTWNPLDKRVSGASTFANGNLDATVGASGSTEEAFVTAAFPTSDKWYCEVTVSNIASGNARIGIGNSATAVDSRPAGGYFYQQDGQKYVLGSASAYGSSWTTNDVIGVAFDAGAGSITFYKNNVSQGAITGISTTTQWILGATGRATVLILNVGQRPFAYTPPSGYLSLCTTNLPASTVLKGSDYFNAITWTGDNSSTGTTRNQTGVGFQPDFVWIKNRSNAYFHNLYDAVRGSGSSKNLSSNTTGSEGDSGFAALYGYLSAFNSDGFQTTNGTDALPGVWVNQTSQTYVAWNWKANGAGVSNTAGSITSTVSANTTSGFSIVTYTGNDTSGATVGHGLGVAPSMFIVKTRSQARGWNVYHTSLGNTKYIQLQQTGAAVTNSAWWNNTSPSSTTFTLGNDPDVNGSTQNYVAYCFAAISGFSAFGSYTGNGSTDGPFVYLGFRPRFILWKRSDGAESWWINDTSRLGYNGANQALFPNASSAENTANNIDILSNGFKIRGSGGEVNASSGTYIYACFAENPFKNSLAR
jgi:hypothetical protein